MSSKILSGKVVSANMTNTIVVEVDTTKKHPLYGKRYTSHKKYKVHTEDKNIEVGNKIIIKESKPISKTKSWVVKEVLDK